MADGVNIKIDDQRVTDLLGEIKDMAANLKPAMDTIGREYLDRVHQAFEDQGLPGYAWPPLAPATIKQRQRKGYGAGQMLRRTGALFRSITWRADKNSVEVGSNSPYAAIHQFGGTISQSFGARVIAVNKKGLFLSHRNARVRKGAVAVRHGRAGVRNIPIPARPFLFGPGGAVPDPWMDGIITTLTNYLFREAMNA